MQALQTEQRQLSTARVIITSEKVKPAILSFKARGMGGNYPTMLN